jgi:acetoin utilization deacetylase AcuC-like enzyme
MLSLFLYTGFSSALSPASYAQMTHMLMGVAPVALMLEGGFNLFETSRYWVTVLRSL